MQWESCAASKTFLDSIIANAKKSAPPPPPRSYFEETKAYLMGFPEKIREGNKICRGPAQPVTSKRPRQVAADQYNAVSKEIRNIIKSFNSFS